MDYDTTTPDDIAAAIAQEIDGEVTSRPKTHGARRAAVRLAELL